MCVEVSSYIFFHISGHREILINGEKIKISKEDDLIEHLAKIEEKWKIIIKTTPEEIEIQLTYIIYLCFKNIPNDYFLHKELKNWEKIKI